jgi:type I restriction enzyme S subunit
LKFSNETNFSSANWSTRKLEELGEIITGSTPSKSNAAYWDSKDFIWVSPSDITDEPFVSDSKNKVSLVGREKVRKLPAGSLLVTCIGSSLGKAAILTVEGSSNQQINAFVPNDIMTSSSYIYYYLQNNLKYFQEMAGQTAVPIINKSTFGQFAINLPPLPEQQKIAEFFTLLDERISKQSEKIAALKDLKKGYTQRISIHG